MSFQHFNGMSGELYFPEMASGGVALFDYDGDGDLDLYLVQGAVLGPGKALEDAIGMPEGSLPASPPRDRLLRNDRGSAGSGGSRFVDVTEAAGLAMTGYGNGVAVGDADGNGFLDLFVVELGTNHLLLNQGDGRFRTVPIESALGDREWSAAATFVDIDGDQDLDLYVANYVDFDLGRNPTCYATDSRRDYCGPAGFEGQPDRLLRNDGTGRFEDASSTFLEGHRSGAGLGVVATDFDGDEVPEIFVSNDGEANFLWVPDETGAYFDDALLAGVALNHQGKPEASMGIAIGDGDEDGDDDLLLTHLNGETNTFYRQGTGLLFEDRSAESGLGAPSISSTGFGAGWLDVDNDGARDLAVFNGAVRIRAEQLEGPEEIAVLPLREPDLFFYNQGAGRFAEHSAAAGASFLEPAVSRGAAFGDLDDDGDTDIVVIDNHGPARLLINQIGQRGAFVGFRFANSSGAELETARLQRLSASNPGLWRSHRDGSYAAANDPRILVGLGQPSPDAAIDIEVDLPTEPPHRWRRLEAGSYYSIFAKKLQESPTSDGLESPPPFDPEQGQSP